MIVIDFTLVDLSQQWHHLGMQHRREQFHMQRRMTESFFQPVTFDIGALGVDLGRTDFLFGGDVVHEGLVEFARKIDLEDQYDKDGWDARKPDKRFEAVLKSNGYRCL